MTNAKHTREPWQAIGLAIYTDRGTPGIETWVANIKRGRADSVEVADARRIVACVNACKGIPTDALESGVIRDLLEALENLENDDGKAMPPSAWALVQTAIAKAKGGAS
ncbi:hypothetical protein [Sediminimonas sp.]|uniref:hypothetical protein n=1 Tax=Sediminimonas sp. TaxID=2823379 RepID=UPI0025F7FFA9|nr:hypothetical protein [Sediminimonas sp.]